MSLWVIYIMDLDSFQLSAAKTQAEQIKLVNHLLQLVSCLPASLLLD